MDPADDTQAGPVWLTRLKLIAGSLVVVIVAGPLFLFGLWFAGGAALGIIDGLQVSRLAAVGAGLFMAGAGGIFLWRLIAALRSRPPVYVPKRLLVVRSRENEEGIAGGWVITLLLLMLVGWADYHFATSRFHTKLWVVASNWVASLAVIGMFGWVLWRTIQLGKFGVAELRLAALVHPGGTLSATMIIPPAARSAQAVFAELVATRLKLLAVTPNENWEITEERSQKRNFPTRQDGNRCVVDFHFEIPPDSPPTSRAPDGKVRIDRRGEYVSWELRVTAVLEGVDFARRFEIELIAESLPKP